MQDTFQLISAFSQNHQIFKFFYWLNNLLRKIILILIAEHEFKQHF